MLDNKDVLKNIFGCYTWGQRGGGRGGAVNVIVHYLPLPLYSEATDKEIID